MAEQSNTTSRTWKMLMFMAFLHLVFAMLQWDEDSREPTHHFMMCALVFYVTAVIVDRLDDLIKALYEGEED